MCRDTRLEGSAVEQERACPAKYDSDRLDVGVKASYDCTTESERACPAKYGQAVLNGATERARPANDSSMANVSRIGAEQERACPAKYGKDRQSTAEHDRDCPTINGDACIESANDLNIGTYYQVPSLTVTREGVSNRIGRGGGTQPIFGTAMPDDYGLDSLFRDNDEGNMMDVGQGMAEDIDAMVKDGKSEGASN